MKGYVYLMVHKDRKMFKVGKARDLTVRINQLEKHWDQFRLEESFALKSNNITNIERLIQRLLSEYHIEGLDRAKDGYSEFYNISCFKDFINDSVSFLNKYQDIELIKLNSNLRTNLVLKSLDLPKGKKDKVYFEDPNLITFKEDLTTVEINLLYYAYKIYEQSNFKEKKIQIYITDIDREIGKRINWSRTYQQTDKLKKFFKNPFLIKNKEIVFASNVEVVSNKRLIEVTISSHFTKYIDLIKQYFSPKKFNSFVNITSIYGKIFFLYLSFFKSKQRNIKEISIKIESLISIFSLKDSLLIFNNINRRVIKAVVDSLNAVGIKIKYKLIKNGRRVNEIKFLV